MLEPDVTSSVTETKLIARLRQKEKHYFLSISTGPEEDQLCKLKILPNKDYRSVVSTSFEINVVLCKYRNWLKRWIDTSVIKKGIQSEAKTKNNVYIVWLPKTTV